jgi:hypothetical protein
MLDRIALRILRGTAGDCRVRPVRFGGGTAGERSRRWVRFFPRPDFVSFLRHIEINYPGGGPK